MKKVIGLLAMISIVFGIIGCGNTSYPGDDVYLPNRGPDVSFDVTGKDLDSGSGYKLTKDEFRKEINDAKTNKKWRKFDVECYNKIVKGVLYNKIIDAKHPDSEYRILKPFNYEGSYYYVYDYNTDKEIDVKDIVIDSNLNVDILILDTSNKLMYEFKYSI